MYRIGEFSKLSNLSVRTLRYYDEIGLLKPEYIDDFTGYRYYTDNNLNESYLINLLKSVNFSLEEIIAYKDCLSGEVIDNKISVLQNDIDNLKFKIKKLQVIKNELSVGSNVKVLTLSKDNRNGRMAA